MFLASMKTVVGRSLFEREFVRMDSGGFEWVGSDE